MAYEPRLPTHSWHGLISLTDIAFARKGGPAGKEASAITHGESSQYRKHIH